jgi:hypothetical protein
MNLSIGQKFQITGVEYTVLRRPKLYRLRASHWVCVFNQDGKPRVKTMPEQKIKEILIGDVFV